jgi:hypothetical protein
MGGIFSDSTPVWGRGTPGVVVGVAQNGTVGFEKVHSRRVTNQALGKAAGSSRKCLRQGGAMRRMRLPFFGGMAG